MAFDITGASWFLLLCLFISILKEISTVETKEYCRWQVFNATCPHDHVIKMETARYGRMKLGSCVTRDYYIGCAGNVLRHADQRCSGRHSCVIKVPDPTLHEVQPCPKDILAYLEAGYSCIPVVTKPSATCRTGKPLVVSGESGNLGSIITEEMRYGTRGCPWLIRVDPGQRINITLFDFGTLKYNSQSPVCQVYANIRERSRTRDVTVCAQGQRVKHLMTSDTNELEVSLVPNGSNDEERSYFVIQYQALGCPTPPKPKHGWSVQTGNSLEVGCNATDSRWHLVCEGNTWVGEFEECEPIIESPSIPYGLLISVAIGVVLGVLLGAAMLAAVLTCRSHSRKGFKQPTEQYAKQNELNIQGQQQLPGERMYAPPYGKQVIRTHEIKDGIVGGGVGGGYAHIWELSQGNTGTESMDPNYNSNSGKRSNVSDPGYYTGGQSSDERGMRTFNPRNRDHVYESPMLVRRDDDSGQDCGITLPYYHEFDPSIAHNDNSPDPYSTNVDESFAHGTGNVTNSNNSD